MEQKSRQILSALINRYHQGAVHPLLSGLPEAEAQELTAMHPTLADPAQVYIYPTQLFTAKIHYSWVTEALKTFDSTLQPLLAASLPVGISEASWRLLPSGDQPLPLLTPQAKLFLSETLARKIGILAVTPQAFLPTEPLSPLLDYTKEQLVQLIDFLALYDLAEEIKSIVDTNTLKLIYNHLSPQKLHFLKSCLHQKQKFSTSKMGLLRWQGDDEQLQRILHRRGLLRLAYALSGHHPHLLWHIVHRLDVGRGRLLEKSYSEKEIPAVSVPLRLQIQNIINFLKKSG